MLSNAIKDFPVNHCDFGRQDFGKTSFIDHTV